MKNKNLLFIPIFMIIIGESLIFLGKILTGLGIHLINLLIIIFLVIFTDKNKKDTKNILQGLILVILLRVVNLSTPQFFTNTLMQYPLMYGIMFIPVFSTIKNQYSELNFKKIYLCVPVGIFIGILMAFFEYRYIGPTYLIDKFKISNIVLISIIMIGFIGTVEEIIFRPILINRLKKIFGSRLGIIFSGILFGIMHSTYGLINEILFAMIFGIILGYIYYKFKSIIFNISIHGAANIMLFGIYPFKMSIISNSIYPTDILNVAGEYMAIFLIILLAISLLVSDSKNHDGYIFNTIGICSGPLLLIFIMIVIYNAILVI